MISHDSYLGTWSRRMDWPTMAAMGVLVAIGLVAVFSAVNPSGASVRYVMKQLVAIGLGTFFIFLLSPAANPGAASLASHSCTLYFYGALAVQCWKQFLSRDDWQ